MTDFVRCADLLGGGRTSQPEFIKSVFKILCMMVVLGRLAFEVD